MHAAVQRRQGGGQDDKLQQRTVHVHSCAQRPEGGGQDDKLLILTRHPAAPSGTLTFDSTVAIDRVDARRVAVHASRLVAMARVTANPLIARRLGVLVRADPLQLQEAGLQCMNITEVEQPITSEHKGTITTLCL